MDPIILMLGYLLLRGRQPGRARGRRPAAPPAGARPPRAAGNPAEQWERAIAQAVAVSPAIAGGLGRAAVMEGAGPPTPETVRGLITMWDQFRAEAEKHKQPGITWDDRDLLWYATIARLRPDLLAGTGQRAQKVTESILRAHAGDPDVFDVVDRATWVATGRRLPPPPQTARAPAPPPAVDQPIRIVPDPLPSASDAASR